MVKVLIYSSKELFDKSSYNGRAEAHIIAYNLGNKRYCITKNRIGSQHISVGETEVYDFQLKRHIERIERDEFTRELKEIKLKEIADVAQR